MRASCSAPNQVTLLRISGVHHEHVPADLGQRVLMASACLLVTSTSRTSNALTLPVPLCTCTDGAPQIIMVIQRSETCE